MAISDAAAQRRSAGGDVIDLAAARAPEPTPDYILQAVRRAMNAGDTHQTAARGTAAFRLACAEKLERDNQLSVDPDAQVLATMGVKQGMALALHALVDPGREVLFENPAFVSYAPSIEMAAARPGALQLDPRAHHQFGDLAGAIGPDTAAIIINNPHNPTGTVRSEAELEAIAKVARDRDLWVISDEVYERVTWGGRKHHCIAALPGMAERTVTLMSLTKAYAMGGWRIGFATGPKEVVDLMTKLQGHAATCASSVAQAAAAVALARPPGESLQGLWRVWEDRCAELAESLDAIDGLSCRAPEGGFFVWLDIRETGQSSAAAAQMLLREFGVAVIPGDAFGSMGEGFLRVTAVKDDASLAHACERIRQAFA